MEDKFRGVFNAVNDAVFIADPEQEIILEANQKAGELMGMPVEELIGRQVSEFYPGDDSREYHQKFRQSMGTGSPRLIKNIEIWMRRSDGVGVPVELNVTMMETMGKRLSIAVFRDLTEKKRLERELAGLKTAASPRVPQSRTESRSRTSTVEGLPGGSAGAAEGVPLEVYISRYVQQTLEKHNGNKAKTARCLGISRPSLYKYLQNNEDI
ncbi:MAG: PAS domain S-box protein [Firmicutes bacterium]|nr:PAS domain S-box protein [Bacillota bacterium]